MNKYLKTTLVILYYFAFNVGIYLPFVLQGIDIDNIPNVLFDTYYMSVEVIFVISLLFIYYKDFTGYFKDFKKHGRDHLKKGLNYWLIGLTVMIISNILISSLTPIHIPENEQAVRDALKLSPLFIVLTTIIDAPIIEEILFRKTLWDIIKNKKLYVVVSGLLFGSFHILGIGTSLYSWLYVIPYSALGMAFAYSYVKTKNLLTPMCLHAFHNFITVMQLLLYM